MPVTGETVRVSVGSVLATGVRPGVRVPVLAATGASEASVPSAGALWVFGFQPLGQEPCVFPATGRRKQRCERGNEGLSAGG